MTEEYTPISCELYSQFELWIMHQNKLRLAWRDVSGEGHIGIVRPVDMRAKSGTEFLYFTELAEETSYRVRLDHIIRAERFIE